MQRKNTFSPSCHPLPVMGDKYPAEIFFWVNADHFIESETTYKVTLVQDEKKDALVIPNLVKAWCHPAMVYMTFDLPDVTKTIDLEESFAMPAQLQRSDHHSAPLCPGFCSADSTSNCDLIMFMC